MKPTFSPELLERMADILPYYGYIALTLSGKQIGQREPVLLTRIFNSTTVYLDVQKIMKWKIPDGFKKRLHAEVIVFEHDTGDEYIMKYQVGEMREGETLDFIPQSHATA